MRNVNSAIALILVVAATAGTLSGCGKSAQEQLAEQQLADQQKEKELATARAKATDAAYDAAIARLKSGK